MCTIGYLKDRNIIFKNRDKSFSIQEELVVNDNILASRTVGDTYFSWGINQYGCGFVSAAINNSRWMDLLYEGKDQEAADFLKADLEGLSNPMQVVSDLLPSIRSADEWVKALMDRPDRWRGYQFIAVDQDKAHIVEIFGDHCEVRPANDRTVLTNHYSVIDHGPKKYEDYPSTYRRYDYANERIQKLDTVDQVLETMNPTNEADKTAIWRSGTFNTVSSSVIDIAQAQAFYATESEQSYHRVKMVSENLDEIKVASDGSRFEMSRYIDLDLYHEVERSHPYYVEMIDEICEKIKAVCDPSKKYRVLEFGAGTGIFTEKLIEMPFLEITALDKDLMCCKMLEKYLRGKGNCRVVQGDASTWGDTEPFDIIVSTFAHDHIHYDLGAALASNIYKNLAPGGHYFMGGEILPFYSTEEERKEALNTYHGFIVSKSLREGNYRLAQIEINALESGVGMVGDFKRHEDLFEKEMAAGDLKQESKTKMGPSHLDDVGGVYVYGYTRP